MYLVFSYFLFHCTVGELRWRNVTYSRLRVTMNSEILISIVIGKLGQSWTMLYQFFSFFFFNNSIGTNFFYYSGIEFHEVQRNQRNKLIFNDRIKFVSAKAIESIVFIIVISAILWQIFKVDERKLMSMRRRYDLNDVEKGNTLWLRSNLTT